MFDKESTELRCPLSRDIPVPVEWHWGDLNLTLSDGFIQLFKYLRYSLVNGIEVSSIMLLHSYCGKETRVVLQNGKICAVRSWASQPGSPSPIIKLRLNYISLVYQLSAQLWIYCVYNYIRNKNNAIHLCFKV